MKVSLTFQDYVKSTEKQYCVHKIQSTVQEIKSYLQLTKRQAKMANKMNIRQVMVNNDKNQFNETLKRNITKRCQQSERQIKSQVQCKQILGFLKHVERTLSFQTSFYQNIIEKIQIMQEKQIKLQKKLMEVTKLLTQQKKTIKNHQCQQSLIVRQPYKMSLPASPTFRANNSSNYQIKSEFTRQEQQIFNELSNNNYKEKAKTIQKQKRINFNSNEKQNINSSINNHKDFIQWLGIEKQSSKQISQIRTINQQSLSSLYKTNQRRSSINDPERKSKHLRENDNQKNKIIIKRSTALFESQNDIAQTAQFLFSFMKLQQEYNKIRKNSCFNHNQSINNDDNIKQINMNQVFDLNRMQQILD